MLKYALMNKNLIESIDHFVITVKKILIIVRIFIVIFLV